jgi:hypothetical protein
VLPNKQLYTTFNRQLSSPHRLPALQLSSANHQHPRQARQQLKQCLHVLTKLQATQHKVLLLVVVPKAG